MVERLRMAGEYSDDYGILTFGIGHVFGRLPITLDKEARGGKDRRPRENFFAIIMKFTLLITTLTSIGVLVLNLYTSNYINRTDIYAPIVIQSITIIWLTLANLLLIRLHRDWRSVKDAQVPDADHGEGEMQGGWSVGADDTDALADLQTHQIMDLTLPLHPKPFCPVDRKEIDTALGVIKRIAYRGMQTAKFSPLFRGIPVLPESAGYYKCLLSGILISAGQVLFIRLYYDFDLITPQTDTLVVCLYWTSTGYYILSFFIFYSLLGLIITSYRQQYLLMRRFTCMLVQQRAARNSLPYFVLNTCENMQAWYAIRQFLLYHTTGPNALSTAMDPTFALLLIGVVSSSLVLIIRQLFNNEEFDLFTRGCFMLLCTFLVCILTITYYGMKIKGHISSHAEVLSHIQWEITRKWNAVLENLEKTPAEARSQASAEAARRLWILRRYTNGLMDTCMTDSQHPKILKASFSNMRWWLVLGLLILNTLLFFAMRRRNPGPKAAMYEL
eukprot:TRINITY_DN27802_c0_g1_i1.p2 TRINITY_DN27802_c0_g1~~TRINITY_DN27802_c0_g1_i1.p2  ORF type:complete len:501 (+),score=182.14 TRINITY_DN27802_c0_g1_i1:42-1544(+)